MLILSLLLACRDKDATPGPDKEALWPFPSAHLVEDGHLSIPQDAVPVPEEGTALDVTRFDARTGFSPVQPALVDLGVALDPSNLPSDADPFGSDAVQVWDLDAGVRVRAMAELDAWPELGGEAPVLIVRPLEPYVAGHTIAIALTGALRDADGGSVAAPAWYSALMEGRPAESLADWEDHYQDLADELADLGVDDLLFAFDFPVQDTGAQLEGMVAELDTPSAWTWDEIRDVAGGDSGPPNTWLQLEGSFTTTSWLGEGQTFEMVDGAPALAGEEQASLFVHIPASARDAAPGTVPVWIFGHGIFGSPETYLADPSDGDAVAELAERAGAIFIGTTWRGLSADDFSTVLAASLDYGKLPRITDRLAQGVANATALARLVLDGGLLDDPELQGLPDRDTVRYYGISLGSIEGAVLLTLEPRLEHAVLHVGGGAWMTMFERSYAWSSLEPSVVAAVPSARDRQLLYAISQLHFDPVDPGGVAGELSDRSVLWQEAMGDELVSNLTTGIITRAAGATQLDPYVEAVDPLASGAAPLSGPALAQYDPELGRPADENRPPAESSGAHTTPRHWEACQSQIVRFLDPDDPGVVEDPCGGVPCTASALGEQ